MLEWYWALFVSGLLGSIGGLLHIIVPPYVTDLKSFVQRYVASWIVGIVLGFAMPLPDTIAFPSAALGSYVIALIAGGYVAIDVVNQWITPKST